jgi:hypothetical protein
LCKVGIKKTDLNSQSYEQDGLFYDVSLKSLNVPHNPENFTHELLNARQPDGNPSTGRRFLRQKEVGLISMMNNSDSFRTSMNLGVRRNIASLPHLSVSLEIGKFEDN